MICEILKHFKSFCGKKDAFDCAGIRAETFRLPVDCVSKGLGSNPNAVERVFFPQKDFKFFKIKIYLHYL